MLTCVHVLVACSLNEYGYRRSTLAEVSHAPLRVALIAMHEATLCFGEQAR